MMTNHDTTTTTTTMEDSQHDVMEHQNNNDCSNWDESVASEHQHHKNPHYVWGLLSVLTLLLVALCGMYGRQQHQDELWQQERQSLEEQRVLLEQAHQLQEELQSTTHALEATHTHLEKATVRANGAIHKAEWIEHELEQADRMMRDDQISLHRSLATQFFGPGPHFAEFRIQLPLDNNNNNKHDTEQLEQQEGEETISSFVIEFASLNEMPSTVYLVMRQIEQGLWDGASFHVGTPQVILAQPVSVTGDASALERMEALGLARLPFAERPIDEQDDKRFMGFPHSSYTLGLGGRVLPGPNFYINQKDNSELHAAKGHAPCFAKVVQGFQTIDQLGRAMGSVDDEEEDSVFLPVEIVSVRLLPPAEL